VAFLKRVSRAWEDRNAGRAAVMTDVARSVMRRDDPAEVTALVSLIGADGVQEWQRAAMVAAVPGKLQDNFGLEKWIEVREEPAAIGVLEASSDPAARKGAQRVAALFKWPGKVMPERPKAKPLTAKEQASFEVGRQVYTMLCGTCHQPDGRGQEGKAPPLAGSRWAVGPEGRLVRIVLHGLRGPVTVGSRTYNMEMPGLKVLTDEQIAGVLTYVRRSWGHEASAVDPKVVQSIRDWNQARRDGWTEKELLRIR
jgi:mono/diheme cytochrome c family protein